MSAEHCDELVERLASEGWSEVEVFAKTGWSRRFYSDGEQRGVVSSEETGWALRAGDGESMVFLAQSGSPTAECALPTALPGRLRLPERLSVGGWRPAEEVEAPLLGEIDGSNLLTAIAETLREETRDCHLQSAVLEDGGSRVRIHNSHGVRTGHATRIASLWLEASSHRARSPCRVSAVARRAQDLHPQALARRLADLVHVASNGVSVGERDARVLLAPQAAARILALIVPLFVEGDSRSGRLDAGSRLGSERVTLIDDGRLEDGLLAAPTDGEGTPTGRLQLVEGGVVAATLRPWWEGGSTGCRGRASWREPPTLGASHFFLEPEPSVSVASLLEDLVRGYYLIEALDDGSIDLESGRFAISCCGFEVDGGRPTRPITGVRVVGEVRRLLGGIRGVGRDLTFFAQGAMIGSPSLLVEGVDLVAARGPI